MPDFARAETDQARKEGVSDFLRYFLAYMQACNPKLYPHFFVLNRVTKLAEHPELGIAHICAWSGKTPKTIAYYLARAGRYSREVGKKLLEEK